MNTEIWSRKGLEEKPLKVQITPLFCYACSRNFTDLDSFKNHEHSTEKKDNNEDNSNDCDWLDLEIKTEFDDEDFIDWSPSNIFSELDNNTTTITKTTSLPSTSSTTIKANNTTPLKSHNQNSQNLERDRFNTNEDRNIPKCLKSPDGIKILCYICHTRFMSLQKFLNHLKSPETNNRTWKCDKEKEEAPQVDCKIKINYTSHDMNIDEDSSHSNQILFSPFVEEEEEQENSNENNNNYEDESHINQIQAKIENIEQDPLKLNEDVTVCPHCTKSFRKPSHLATHIRISHSQSSQTHLNSDSNESDPDYQNDDQDVYVEEINTKKRRRLSKSTRNERDNIKDSQCSNCLHIFHSPRELKRHLNGIKQLHQDCMACGLSFEWSCTFRRHEKEVHRENKRDENNTKDSRERFKCQFSDCGRTFSRKKQFQLHTKIHTGKKPFKCEKPGCDRRFNRNAELLIHKLRHDKTKPFPCPNEGCDKAFYTKKDLDRHSTIHLPEKPFKCNFIDPESNSPCDRAFRNPSELRIHMNKHTGRIIFTCPESTCGKVWRVWTELKHHVRNQHPSISATLKRSQVVSINENNNEDSNDFSINNIIEDSTSRMTMDSINEDENAGENNSNNNNNEPIIFTKDKNSRGKPRSYKCAHPGCSAAFNSKRMVQRHHTIHMPEKPFKCDFILSKTGLPCTRAFRVKHKLNNHMNKHTGHIIYKCEKPGCDKTFRDKRALNYHIKFHDVVRKRRAPEPGEKTRRFKCSTLDCQSAFYTRNVLKQHMLTHITEKPFKCSFLLEDSQEICGRQFRLVDELKVHENIHTRKVSFECPHSKCGKVFYIKSGLMHHRRRVHPTPQQVETKIVRQKAELDSRGEKGRSFKCTSCDAGFFTSRERDRHLTVHLPEKPFKCDYLDLESGLVCRRAFRIQSELKLHTNVHTKEKIFKCPYSNSCSETFYETRVLKEHIRTKHGDGEDNINWDGNGPNFRVPHSVFKCYEGDCNGKCFAYASALKSHQERTHFSSTKFRCMCEICGKTLCNANTLKAHLKSVHEQVTNHLCTYCGAGFYSRGVFNRHVLIQHLKETPFPCESCDRKFRFQYVLNRHVARVHKGQDLKTWICDWNNGECKKSFLTKGGLRRHSYVHTGERPYQCPVEGCTAAYPDPRPWKRHVKNAHPEYTEVLVHPSLT